MLFVLGSIAAPIKVAADESVIFDLPYEERWLASLRLLGVEAGQLTSFSGHA